MYRKLGLALAACTFLFGNGPAAPDPLSRRAIADFASSHGDDSTHKATRAWQADLRAALAHADIDRAADAIAARWHLSNDQMRSLARLWLTSYLHHYDFDREPALRDSLHRQWLAFLAATPHSPLVLDAATEGLNDIAECQESDFAPLMAGSTRPAEDAWRIAVAAPCGGNFLRAAAVAPDRAMPALIQLAHYGALPRRDELPLYAWLTTPSALSRIAQADRTAVSAWLYANYARLLFATGLTERAVTLLEALPLDLRRRVLEPQPERVSGTIDGLPVEFETDQTDETLIVNLAAAYAVRGRTNDAETLFGTLRGVAAARALFDCSWDRARGETPACRGRSGRMQLEDVIDMLLLDHLLHHPNDDPYPFAETAFSHLGAGDDVVAAELRCHVFAEPQLVHLCRGAHSIQSYLIMGERSREGDEASQLESIRRLALSGLAEFQASFATDYRRLIADNPDAQRDLAEHADRQSIVAPASIFAETQIPAANRGTRPRAVPWPGDMTHLPQGFLPVRFERSGQRAVAISVSQTYDPTGEVSQGGYWVHLSDDGGRHWQRPYYTGLADRFPYVVPPASNLPLIAGNHLNLEVEVEEIDTASITYPPVGLQSRRRASGLYLRIPLADLTRDGDNDGVTDLAAHSLLLDRPRAAGAAPFIVGSDDRAACAAPSRERQALIALFAQLFHAGGRVIVESVDRPPGDIGAEVAGWRAAAAAVDQPIFLEGDPRDFARLNPNRLMIVYSADDIAALHRTRPDFHAIESPHITFNRARDRGYATWSAGWTGGTYRLRLVNGAWIVDELSSWIT